MSSDSAIKHSGWEQLLNQFRKKIRKQIKENKQANKPIPPVQWLKESTQRLNIFNNIFVVLFVEALETGRALRSTKVE